MNRQKIEKNNIRWEIIFSHNFSVARIAKSSIVLDNRIYIRFDLLELSMLLMCEFHYEHMKQKYSGNIDLCSMYIESLKDRYDEV